MSKKMKKGLVPELRFPEFRDSGEWKLSPLKKLATSCTEKNRDGNIVRVLTNSAEHGIVDQRDYFDKDIAVQGNLEGYFIVKKGDFVYNPRISSMAPVGPISKNNIATGVMSPLYTVFRFNFENVDYYAHFFKTTGWHHYMRQVSSTGARHDRMAISKSDFIAMPIPTPPVQEEQERISDCLSSLDELIEAHIQKHEALQSYKKGLMQNLFPDEGETVPALRFPQFNDDLKTVSFSELGKVMIGLTHKPEYVSFGKPFLSSKNISNGYIDFENIKYISEEKFSSMPDSTKPKVGDILFTRVGSNLGNPIILEKDREFGIFVSLGFLRVRNGVSNYYVKHWMNSDIFWKQVNQKVAGGAKNNLNTTWLKEFELSIPSFSEQQKIADFLSSVDDLIKAQTQKIEKLKAHKKGLMAKLFPAVGGVL
ncbi:restriction endonuclease subunit S [Glaciecola sp. MH2013]|uniref:restriction endonuclease subunit S n=1 Tax=Glaciecola sp. MH2013 TaxID=2785524 RepID=UPI0018A10968|nr:restriction endonuclease subunit S [Glaciecola sp. MH2013]MBF7074312.1 restriction endonuclease subunit S [Glaciecola sp. MH2013]